MNFARHPTCDVCSCHKKVLKLYEINYIYTKTTHFFSFCHFVMDHNESMALHHANILSLDL